ncbi:MAG: hypothetical protein IT314_11870 [Anaerolineales bacterium]|nr:hypothetical protein [Anaerolineales bacterium]
MKSFKRFVCACVLLAVGISACGASETPAATAPPNQVETVVAATVQAITEAAPTEVTGATVSFNNVSFIIPNGLASGATPTLEPAVGGDASPWEMAPEHIVFTLTGYSGPSRSEADTATIHVYPAQPFAEVSPGASISIPQLQALLASPSAPITAESAPGVPFYNAGQIIAAKGSILNFQNGAGVRVVSHFTQFPGPITQTGQVYHFQGLTSDGKYYVIALFPILSPLQSTSENPSADGVNFPDYASAAPGEMDAYYQALTEKLNAADPASFSPSLDQLDALIESITIAP